MIMRTAYQHTNIDYHHLMSASSCVRSVYSTVSKTTPSPRKVASLPRCLTKPKLLVDYFLGNEHSLGRIMERKSEGQLSSLPTQPSISALARTGSVDECSLE